MTGVTAAELRWHLSNMNVLFNRYLVFFNSEKNWVNNEMGEVGLVTPTPAVLVAPLFQLESEGRVDSCTCVSVSSRVSPSSWQGGAHMCWGACLTYLACSKTPGSHSPDVPQDDWRQNNWVPSGWTSGTPRQNNHRTNRSHVPLPMYFMTKLYYIYTSHFAN